MWQVWLLPLLVFGVALGAGDPDRPLHGPGLRRPSPPAEMAALDRIALDTGPQNWKQYAFAFMAFNVVTFLVGFAVLALQPYLPLNPDGKKMLGPTMIFHTVTSFLTNTNQQHYSGEVHLSYFSQLFFICWKQAISPMIGMAALVAIIRGLRGDKHMGNFYVDLWRGTAYVFVPLCLVVGVLLMASGVPMTLEGTRRRPRWSRVRWERTTTASRNPSRLPAARSRPSSRSSSSAPTAAASSGPTARIRSRTPTLSAIS